MMEANYFHCFQMGILQIILRMSHLTYQDLFPLSCSGCSPQRKHWRSELCTFLNHSQFLDYSFRFRPLLLHDSCIHLSSWTFGLWIRHLRLDPVAGCRGIPPSNLSCWISPTPRQFVSRSVLVLYVRWSWLVCVLFFASQNLPKGGYCLL